jgi:uncharacterized membrane protein
MLPVYTVLQQIAERNDARPAILILAVVCVVVTSSLALAVSIGLARRIQEIGDQGPQRTPSDADDDRF